MKATALAEVEAVAGEVAGAIVAQLTGAQVSKADLASAVAKAQGK
jgi:hypothetical protein